VAGWLPSPVTGFLSLIGANLTEILARLVQALWRLVSGSILGALLGLVLAIALGFLSWLTWGQVRRRLQMRRLARLHPLNRLYQKMLLHLQEQGYPKSATQTPREYVNALPEYLNPAQRDIIKEISLAYEAWHYGHQPQNVDYLERQGQILLRSLARQKMPQLALSSFRFTPRKRL